MSKTENCLKLLEILNTGRTFKVDELARLLGTNSRNIPEYKKELELCGYDIYSTSGRYGGYYLNKSSMMPQFNLLDEEKKILIDTFNYCLSKKDFIDKETLTRTFSKICSNLSLPEFKDKPIVVNQYQLTMSEEEINDRYHFIENAIENTTTVDVVYESLKTGIDTHTINPYKLFIFNNTWFFLGLDLTVKDVRTFKINRIKEYKLTNKKFTIPNNFNAEDYFVCNGFKTEGEFIHVKFIARNEKKRLIKERIYGKNQVITDIDEESALVEFDMQDEEMILFRLLSFGPDVTLLEPESLVIKLKDKIEKMRSLYDEYFK